MAETAAVKTSLSVGTPVLRSALEDALRQLSPQPLRERAGVRVADWSPLACIVLRGQQGDAAFLGGVQTALGLALPLQPSTWVSAAGPQGQVVALWLSPDEWWLLLPRAGRDGVMTALATALAGVFAQVVDNSGSLVCLRLAGPEHRTVLRHLGPIDVESLQPGRCVSTVWPKANVTVVSTDAAGVVLVFRRSFADWIWRLLERSAQPYGLALCTPAQLPTPVFSALLTVPHHSSPR